MRPVTVPPSSVAQRLARSFGLTFEEDTLCQSVKRHDTGTDYLPEYLTSLKASRTLRCHRRR